MLTFFGSLFSQSRIFGSFPQSFTDKIFPSSVLALIKIFTFSAINASGAEFNAKQARLLARNLLAKPEIFGFQKWRQKYTSILT